MRIILLLILFGTAACSTLVTKDYGQYLKNNSGKLKLENVNVGKHYHTTERTQKHSYKIKSFAAGWGNSWIVKAQPLIEETLKSEDVKQALGDLTLAQDLKNESERVLLIDVMQYEYYGHTARIQINFAVKEKGQTLFEKSYLGTGAGQGGKVFWGGALAMKNAVQQSTKVAMDQILTNFTNDLKNGLKTKKM